MKTKILAFVIFFVLISTLLQSQDKPFLKPVTNNDLKHSEDIFPITNSDVLVHNIQLQNLSGKIYDSVLGTLDTLSNLKMWSGSETAVAFYGQDVLMQRYVAPANMTIKAVGYKTAGIGSDAPTVNVRLFKLNPWWDFQKLSDAHDKQWGYFPSAGDGFNDITPFPSEATGPYQDLSGLSCLGILDTCIWSANDFGYNSTPIVGQYVWIEMNVLGSEPSVNEGDIIAVVIQNNSTVMQNDNAWNARVEILANSSPATVGYHQFIFYEHGKFGIDDRVGWWSHEADLDIILTVDITGDRAPVIKSVTDIPDTYSNDPMLVEATITDDNPSGGSSGISSVYLYYKVNDGIPDSVEMTYAGGDIYNAEIPGFFYGTNIIYYVKATDVANNASLPFGFSYNVRDYNDFYYYININKVKMWQSNNGIGSHDPIAPNTHGFYWPYDENDSTGAVHSDGLLWGGYINGNLRVGGNHHQSGLEAGKILPGGIPDSVTSPRCRVYRIRKDWESLPPGPLKDSLETDYNNWPVEDGAPWVDINGNGTFERGIDQPEFIGDEVLWFVANDLDTSRTHSLYGSDEIGLEMQVTTFAYDSTNDLADMVFKKYKLINKSGSTVNDMYLSYWSDPDLGDAYDDFIGCDTLLNLGYTYNGNDYDSNYGSPPPSVGYNLLRGPIVPAASYQYGFLNGTWRKGYKNLDMTSFNYSYNGDPTYGDPTWGEYEGTIQTYNLLGGLDKNGSPITNPTTGQVTKYCFPGDPVTASGWTEQTHRWPGDKRHYISMGPFNFAENDTQEVMIAILIDKGTDRLNSITELKNKDEFLQGFYYDHFLPRIPDFEIQCDMTNQIAEGSFNPLSDQVKVMANFNGWNGDAMTDPDGDLIYSFSLYNVEFDSLLEFKFWTTPNRWEAFPERRIVEVGASPGGYYAYFNDDSVYSPPKNIIVRYRCDMSIEIQFERFNSATDQVKLMGYQYWWGIGVEMINNGSNVYEYTDTLSLGVNDYIPGYKFFYTPDTWEGGDNKTYQVNQGDYDFGEINIYRFFNQDELPSVEFQCDMTVQVLEGNFNPGTDRVELRGNFNGWDANPYEMTDPDNDWIYTYTLWFVETDSHLVYKFWHSSNNTWEGDPSREYIVVPNPQTIYDYFNRDDDPTNGERLWEVQTSNTTNALMEVGFVDDTKGWIVGNPGVILNTANGGEAWVNQTSNTTQTLWSVSFIDGNTGWAAGNAGVVLKTSNAGTDWSLLTGITSQPLREVFFIDANTGWIAGAMGTIMKTTDGGTSWNAQTTNTSLRFQSIFFTDLNNGWAVGENGMIMHTTNGGQNWVSQISNTTNYLLDVYFKNLNLGWAVGWGAAILKTTDGGNNWIAQNSKLPSGGIRNRLYNVWFTDSYHGWAIGTYGTIRYTSDGGSNWLPQYSSTTQDLYGVMFPSNNFGWIVGNSGTVLKYLNETPFDWTVNLGVTDAGGLEASNQLVFGQNINATDGIDPSLGEEELPPVPQPGAFDARFILPDPTIASWVDFRNSAKTKIDWIIQFQPGTAGYPITFSWDINQLPAGLFYLKDVIDGSIININMREQNSYALTNEGINYLKIEFKKQVCSDIDLIAGWNMISVPSDGSDMRVNYLFPTATSNAFGFDNQYIVCDTLEPGKGYWLRFANPDAVELCGIVSPDTAYVKNGWNMIGLFEFNVTTGQITTDPSGIIVSSFFGFNDAYYTTTNLETGKGYWVKVNSDGKLLYNRLQKRNAIENYADAFENWGKIILQDKNGSSATMYSADKSANLTFYEVPPLPPAGIFDVRFSSNRNAEVISAPKDIIITSAEYPVILKVENTSLKVKDKIDGNRINKLLKSGEELVITDPAIKIIEVSGELIPDKFELSQNYPNPFNPSTTIRFALPVSSKVRISLYNILGELVADIVNKEYDAGYHQVVFNGNVLASGVYFYRIEAGNFMDVKKMMMIK